MDNLQLFTLEMFTTLVNYCLFSNLSCPNDSEFIFQYKVLESGKAEMVDLMKYLLSYASNPSVSSERNNLYSRDHIESSVRNLLSDLTEMSSRAPMSNLSAPEQYQVSEVHRQTPRPLGQNIEMKRGDWICPKYVIRVILFYLNPFCFRFSVILAQRYEIADALVANTLPLGFVGFSKEET